MIIMAKIGGYASWYWQLLHDVCVCDVKVIESGLLHMYR